MAEASRGPQGGDEATPIPSARFDNQRQSSNNRGFNVQQPKPQALPSKSGPSSIIVSPRQKGNPVLNNIRQMPWEYGDIPADFQLGATTCALFLSLTYHRIHPEYVYNRIRALQHKFNLRILLTLVDVTNHEEPLKELSKTSLINNVTLILCWTSQEAGRYLELFKSYEHAAPTSIRAHQSTSFSDRLVDFITVPRSVNKTDAVNLVSAFGSVRTAVNATPEEISMISGWGGKKVQRWCKTVREPFRIQKTAKRVGARRAVPQNLEREDTGGSAYLDSESPMPLAQDTNSVNAVDVGGPDEDEEMALREVTESSTASGVSKRVQQRNTSQSDTGLPAGVAAALEKLRRE